MKLQGIVRGLIVLVATQIQIQVQVQAGVMQYGATTLPGTSTTPTNPTAGATLQGLAPGVVTLATQSFTHPFPFSPVPGAYPGTDLVYDSGAPTPVHDGYTGTSAVTSGPQVLTMNYGSLVPAGQKVDTLTLGIAADDFQQPVFHEPYTAKVNGVTDAALSNELNALNLSGPKVQFLTVGIAPSVLTSSNVLTLSIDRSGPAGDAWAVDYTTIGVTTTVPEPSTLWVLAVGSLVVGLRSIRSRRASA